MSKIHDLIRNADDRTMVDFRVDNQIDSVPIEDLRAVVITQVELLARMVQRSATPSDAENWLIAEAERVLREEPKANGLACHSLSPIQDDDLDGVAPV